VDINLLSGHIDNFSRAKILCVGDIILDNFVYGAVNRISPEAPVPVFSINNEKTMLGGAGNVIRNVAALGGKGGIISSVGDDETGRKLTRMVGEMQGLEAYLQVEKGRISSKKTRYIAGNQQLLRADHETSENIFPALEEKILQLLDAAIPGYDVVILSDYAKGTLTQKIVRTAIDAAKKLGKTTIVDPKSRDFSIYSGASIITPNLAELQAAAGKNIGDRDELVSVCRALTKKFGFGNILVTKGKDGMTLVGGDTAADFPALVREIYDVSGAGDTVVATLATALASGVDLQESAYLANLAGGIAVERLGTSVVSAMDLKAGIFSEDFAGHTVKILPISEAQLKISRWRETGKKIGFTNGCFDLIHPGHVSLLSQARAGCDRLVVAINSDESVKRLKGDNRPVQNEISRAMVLASLAPVDLVVIFAEDTPLETIQAIRPDLLVKGADYTIDKVIGADVVKSYGGKVMLAKISDGHSTSGLIRKMGT